MVQRLGEIFMGKSIFVALAAAASLGLAGCSEKTQDAAETTVDSAANDVAGAADAATDEMGAKVEQGAAEVEADAHNETVKEAKAD
jgi:hypothetical protein